MRGALRVRSDDARAERKAVSAKIGRRDAGDELAVEEARRRSIELGRSWTSSTGASICATSGSGAPRGAPQPRRRCGTDRGQGEQRRAASLRSTPAVRLRASRSRRAGRLARPDRLRARREAGWKRGSGSTPASVPQLEWALLNYFVDSHLRDAYTSPSFRTSSARRAGTRPSVPEVRRGTSSSSSPTRTAAAAASSCPPLRPRSSASHQRDARRSGAPEEVLLVHPLLPTGDRQLPVDRSRNAPWAPVQQGRDVPDRSTRGLRHRHDELVEKPSGSSRGSGCTTGCRCWPPATLARRWPRPATSRCGSPASTPTWRSARSRTLVTTGPPGQDRSSPSRQVDVRAHVERIGAGDQPSAPRDPRAAPSRPTGRWPCPSPAALGRGGAAPPDLGPEPDDQRAVTRCRMPRPGLTGRRRGATVTLHVRRQEAR